MEGRVVRVKVPKNGLRGLQTRQESVWQLRVLLFSQERPLNTYKLNLRGLPQTILNNTSGQGALAVKLLEAFLTRDLLLPIYDNPGGKNTSLNLDLAELATREEVPHSFESS